MSERKQERSRLGERRVFCLDMLKLRYSGSLYYSKYYLLLPVAGGIVILGPSENGLDNLSYFRK